MKPRPTHFALGEASPWIEWQDWKGQPTHLHAIKFEDGSIFDSKNGWRAPVDKEAKRSELPTPIDMRPIELMELALWRGRDRAEPSISNKLLMSILIEELQRIQRDHKMEPKK